MTRAWGSSDLDDRDYDDPDPRRYDTADAAWARTQAALDRDAAVAIYDRMCMCLNSDLDPHSRDEHTDCTTLSCGGCDECLSVQLAYFEGLRRWEE